MKDNSAIKKQSPRPADPVIIQSGREQVPATESNAPTGEAAQETAQLRLQAFDDGYIFKFTGHPVEKGRFVLFDRVNQPVAVVNSAPIADLLCQSVKMLFAAVAERDAREAALTGGTLEEKAARNAEHKAKHRTAPLTDVVEGGTFPAPEVEP